MPYEDSNSRENVHGSYGHREFVNLTSDSTAENVFTNQELECKSYVRLEIKVQSKGLTEIRIS